MMDFDMNFQNTVAVPTVSAFDNWEVIQVKGELCNTYMQNSVCIEKLDCYEYIRS